MTAKLILPLVALLMPGCAGPDVGKRLGIQLKRTDSASVVVSTARLKSDSAGMFVEGYLSKSRHADSTRSAHVDIFGYDAQGGCVTEQLGAFTPGEIPGRFRGVGGRRPYRVPLDFPLTNITRLEVRAHEGGHALR